MKANHIFETVLYCEDLGAAKHFYANILGLDLFRETELYLGFRLLRSILLIFNPKLSAEKDRPIPSHGTNSYGHIAFVASQEEIWQWKDHLEKHGIEIEKLHNLENGGSSLYVRDPAGNSVEFTLPTIWSGNWNFTSERFE
jgi:catechol 2,3-dioxygenase-like lactoylglutathione lyase family enzyme